jgi:dipeptidyl aminopeptidase/acylaminoacyl peptidase
VNAENFEELVEFDWTKERGVIPLGFDHDPNQLYVRSVHEGRWAIFKIDLSKAGKPRELVAADPEYDIEGGLIYWRDLRAVVGVNYSADQARTLYWDKRVRQMTSRVNAALPGRHNMIISSTDDSRRHVVLSTAPSQPPQFYIFDRAHDRVVKLANMYPALPVDEMRTPETVVIRARDGLQLHGYLTTPTAREPRALPLIMFPHGGPWARDTDHFNPWVQFFVNRGWAVLQVNFRGSKGYGEAFERAGFQRWGLAMQDDLTDSAQWAIQ